MKTQTLAIVRDEQPRPTGRSAARVVAGVTATALLLTLVALWTIGFLSGMRWFVVETPSMGETAPVGSLIVTEPVSFSDIRAGDVITFHPPSSPQQVYSHRVESVNDGHLLTRGDLNGSVDPWLVKEADIIGRSAAILPGVGWLMRAIPLLIAGSAIVWACSRWLVADRWRAPLHIVGASLVVSATAFILRPFVSIAMLGVEAQPDGTKAHVVSTGLFPIRVEIPGGSSAHLLSGQLASLESPQLTSDGYYNISSALDLTPLEWVLLLLVCAAPLIWCLVVGLPPLPSQPEPHAASAESDSAARGNEKSDVPDEPDEPDEPGVPGELSEEARSSEHAYTPENSERI